MNKLDIIIRGHECVMDGCERMGENGLITLISCTDFGGIFNNSASMITIKKNFEIIPKII